jgi:REP element-mobilizing transposase RayT
LLDHSSPGVPKNLPGAASFWGPHRKEFRNFLKPYYWKPVFWKRGYGFVSAGGAPLKILKEYIENQGYDD